ncbi:Mu transposase C-terminal domain-containing protein [Cryobacterium sp. TMT2-15-1]|uniref:Mu transposase C-terminal domain-containing protein n=1 Tax=Cryobacterium sp. TMT2-15-1 TaxID=1259246 RepID=UPI001F53FD9E|nr:Mu transposase C-terminal domain-containing protein [Cryobacterium sp. TMT2-15-1]
MPDTLEELDGLLLTVPKHRTVQRDGIHFQGQHYLAPTVASFVGRTITIRYDPRDLSDPRLRPRHLRLRRHGRSAPQPSAESPRY